MEDNTDKIKNYITYAILVAMLICVIWMFINERKRGKLLDEEIEHAKAHNKEHKERSENSKKLQEVVDTLTDKLASLVAEQPLDYDTLTPTPEPPQNIAPAPKTTKTKK